MSFLPTVQPGIAVLPADKMTKGVPRGPRSKLPLTTRVSLAADSAGGDDPRASAGDVAVRAMRTMAARIRPLLVRAEHHRPNEGCGLRNSPQFPAGASAP